MAATPSPSRRTSAPARRAKRASTDPLKHARVRVRMFRHGLGDCFLLTFPRKKADPFHMLIDFGALKRDADTMRPFAEEILRAVTRRDGTSRIDAVVVTHEHLDHLSGFHQTRDVLDKAEFGEVWMAWTEDPHDRTAKKLREMRSSVATALRGAVSRLAATAAEEATLKDARAMLEFIPDEALRPSGLAARGPNAGAYDFLRSKVRTPRYLTPGGAPLTLDGVEGVRVYVLGPPRDKEYLSRSTVTKKMKDADVVYHMAGMYAPAITPQRSALAEAALAAADPDSADTFHPFGAEHRFVADTPGYDQRVRYFAETTYEQPSEQWRRIDTEWHGVFDQLALKLDSDTNNTSLVLAFELVDTGEVLLFPGDAQVGNWQSWSTHSFRVPGSDEEIRSEELLKRTVFYKVGHHASHNATLKNGGLELMDESRLVSFIPLDITTAHNQGSKGWEMPAPALFTALKARSGERVVISDVQKTLPAEAARAGVVEAELYYDYFL